MHQHARCKDGRKARAAKLAKRTQHNRPAIRSSTPRVPLPLRVALQATARTSWWRASRRNGSDLHRSFSPRELADYRHCEGGATSWSQSRESNSRVHGYGPRRCTSTDCKDRAAPTALRGGHAEHVGAALGFRTRARCGARVVVIFRSPRINSPVTKLHRPAKKQPYHREDSNLSQQASQPCVPSLERWQVNRRSDSNRRPLD